MAPALPELVNELKMLRKGRGLFVSHIDERVGTALRAACAVTEEDGPAQIRQKVFSRLENLARDLPTDLRVAVTAAFGIAPDARLPLYQDRVSWAASKLNRDPRTARRRIDDGIHHLAQLAAVSPPEPAARATSDWRTAELRLALALDRPSAEVLQYRRVVAERDGVRELDLAMTVAAPAGERIPVAGDLGVHLFHGGTLVTRGTGSTGRFTFSLLLPRPLDRGEAHDFALQVSLPAGRPLRPYFVSVLEHPCDELDLRVRFDRRRPPAAVWSLRGAHQHEVTTAVPAGERVALDHAGETRIVARDLTQGRVYGLRWFD